MAVTRLTTNGLTGTKYDIASADNYYMEPIATNLLASATSTITFSNIPNTYKHLQIRYIARSTRADAYGYFRIRFNGDSGSNYSSHNLYGTGATVASNASTSASSIESTQITGASATASIFGAGVIDILDYANTNKFKTERFLTGDDRNNTQGFIYFKSGLWMNTAAITSITISDEFNNFDTNTRFSLYGIKG